MTDLQLGAVFPQVEIGTDLGAIRAYFEGVEDLGFAHVVLFDHVLGADLERPELDRSAWPPNHYSYLDQFHEPFVLLGFAAAATTRLGLTTGILVLPQRQTALVAKQATEVQLLSGGRLRLGVATGWNHLEYEALGAPFDERGRMLDEQVAVMRRLWADPIVDFDGDFHRLSGVGLAPRPPGGAIPVWFGGFAPVAYRRAARIGDGFLMSRDAEHPDLDRDFERLWKLLEDAGRDRAGFGVEGRVSATKYDSDAITRHAARWRALGASHLAIDTMQRTVDLDWRRTGKARSVDEHLELLARAKDAASS